MDPLNESENKVRNDLKALLVKADELAPVLLQTNHDSSDHCLTYLRDGVHSPAESAETNAERRLLDAIEDCEEYVNTWVASGRQLIELLALVKNRLSFILHEISDEGLVYSVFEVLNSRGLCVFRRKPATDSGSMRPLIPVQAGHQFRSNPATLTGVR